MVALVAVLPATVTLIVPVVAPVGTIAVMPVAVLAVTTAVVPLNFTVLLAGIGSKSVPVMVTVEPTRPLGGAKLLMVVTEAVFVNVPSAVKLHAPVASLARKLMLCGPTDKAEILGVALSVTLLAGTGIGMAVASPNPGSVSKKISA